MIVDTFTAGAVTWTFLGGRNGTDLRLEIYVGTSIAKVASSRVQINLNLPTIASAAVVIEYADMVKIPTSVLDFSSSKSDTSARRGRPQTLRA